LTVGTATALVEFVADEETVAHHNACPEKNRQLARNMEPDLGLRCMVYSRNKTKARSMVAAEDVCPAIVVEELASDWQGQRQHYTLLPSRPFGFDYEIMAHSFPLTYYD
jgi:hypothetical protein